MDVMISKTAGSKHWDDKGAKKHTRDTGWIDRWINLAAPVDCFPSVWVVLCALCTLTMAWAAASGFCDGVDQSKQRRASNMMSCVARGIPACSIDFRGQIWTCACHPCRRMAWLWRVFGIRVQALAVLGLALLLMRPSLTQPQHVPSHRRTTTVCGPARMGRRPPSCLPKPPSPRRQQWRTRMPSGPPCTTTWSTSSSRRARPGRRCRASACPASRSCVGPTTTHHPSARC